MSAHSDQAAMMRQFVTLPRAWQLDFFVKALQAYAAGIKIEESYRRGSIPLIFEVPLLPTCLTIRTRRPPDDPTRVEPWAAPLRWDGSFI
jgi:hypothetical protein